MALRFAAVAGLVAVPAFGISLGTQTRVCGPQTTVSFSSSANAAGTPVFGETIPAQDGVCNAYAADVTLVKFCGPGKLSLSRMTCNQHDYKANTFEHSKEAVTTGCETISVSGTNAAGHLGSWTVTC
eukprot:TRINITY_DN95_c0_g1_i1.p2 TRINITY_DN95_c0_g1~~TRINITY_DN95_c0_g1_i1.p2  ORF type:complete len:127 (+),score=20.24 TRINITY_DN95_c0_g1_i1:237-617(+)